MKPATKRPSSIWRKPAASTSRLGKSSAWCNGWGRRPKPGKNGKPSPAVSAVPIMYVSADGTGVPMRKEELAGRVGKQPDGTAKTRMAYLGCVFTQHQTDEKGHPVRDYESTTYVSSFGPIEEFGPCLRQDAIRRGLALALQVVLLIDGAEGLANMGRLCFPSAIQIVDFYHALEHAGKVLVALLGSKEHPDYKTRLGRWAKTAAQRQGRATDCSGSRRVRWQSPSSGGGKGTGLFRQQRRAHAVWHLSEPKASLSARGSLKRAAKPSSALGASSRACSGANPGPKTCWPCAASTAVADCDLFWKDRLNAHAARNDSLALAA